MCPTQMKGATGLWPRRSPRLLNIRLISRHLNRTSAAFATTDLVNMMSRDRSARRGALRVA